MNIPEEAIEAAAWKLDPYTMGSGGPLAEKFQEATRAEARVALEAAAPYLMAQAWDEALDDMEGCCAFLSDIEEHKAANPYRAEER